jgi:hypothetical protein
MFKSYLNGAEIFFISCWLYYFGVSYDYFFSDPIFWYRCKLTFCSLASIVIVRYDERIEELELKLISEAEANLFYKMITWYDLGWIFCLWLLRFNLPVNFFPKIYNDLIVLFN